MFNPSCVLLLPPFLMHTGGRQVRSPVPHRDHVYSFSVFGFSIKYSKCIPDSYITIHASLCSFLSAVLSTVCNLWYKAHAYSVPPLPDDIEHTFLWSYFEPVCRDGVSVGKGQQLTSKRGTVISRHLAAPGPRAEQALNKGTPSNKLNI